MTIIQIKYDLEKGSFLCSLPYKWRKDFNSVVYKYLQCLFLCVSIESNSGTVERYWNCINVGINPPISVLLEYFQCTLPPKKWSKLFTFARLSNLFYEYKVCTPLLECIHALHYKYRKNQYKGIKINSNTSFLAVFLWQNKWNACLWTEEERSGVYFRERDVFLVLGCDALPARHHVRQYSPQWANVGLET